MELEYWCDMYKKNILFFYKYCCLGGAELLIAKLSKFFSENASVALICQSITPDIKKEIEKSGVRIIQVDVWDSTLYMKQRIKEYSEPYCITFVLNDYIMLRGICTSTKHTILYAIHFYVLVGNQNSKFKKLRKKLREHYLPVAIRDNSIVVMDETIIREAKNFYGKSIEFSSLYDKIVRISVEDSGFDADKYNSKNPKTELRILAIARADFPFKGYLLGLVRKFPEYYDCNTYLDIVAYGPGENRIIEEINKLPSKMSEHISLYGKMEYDQLIPIIDKSCLYVGMGTTILDASVRKVIAIPVVPYTEAVVANSFFYENYKSVICDVDEDRFLTLVNRLKEMSLDEYHEICDFSRNIVLKYYETKKNAEMLLNFLENSSVDKKNVWISFTDFLRKIKLKLSLLFRRRSL